MNHRHSAGLLLLIAHILFGVSPDASAQSLAWSHRFDSTMGYNYLDFEVGPDAIAVVWQQGIDDDLSVDSARVITCFSPEGDLLWTRTLRIERLGLSHTNMAVDLAAADDGSFWLLYHVGDTSALRRPVAVRTHLGPDGSFLSFDTLGLQVSTIESDGSVVLAESLPVDSSKPGGYRFFHRLRWDADLSSVDTLVMASPEIGDAFREGDYGLKIIENERELVVAATLSTFFGRSVVVRKQKGGESVTRLDMSPCPACIIQGLSFHREGDVLIYSRYKDTVWKGWIARLHDGVNVVDSSLFYFPEFLPPALLSFAVDGSVVLFAPPLPNTTLSTLYLVDSTHTPTNTVPLEDVRDPKARFHPDNGLYIIARSRRFNPLRVNEDLFIGRVDLEATMGVDEEVTDWLKGLLDLR